MERNYKECKSCGKTFMPTDNKQVNCPECRTLKSWQKTTNAQKLKNATKRNARMYYDPKIEIVELKCLDCGKSMKYVVRKRKENFCDNICPTCNSIRHEQNRIRNTKCGWCGKNMLETDDIRDTHGAPWFCCDECKEAAKWENARKNGKVKTCPICGTEFIKNTTFCSTDCYLKNRKIQSTGRKPISEEERHEKAKRREGNHIFKNGLCPICDNFPKCEYTLSEPQTMPEGAFRCDGNIMVCPNFKSSKLKYLKQEDIIKTAKMLGYKPN